MLQRIYVLIVLQVMHLTLGIGWVEIEVRARNLNWLSWIASGVWFEWTTTMKWSLGSTRMLDDVDTSQQIADMDVGLTVAMRTATLTK